ncbi:MAG: acylphosphatase [Leptolyngbyaceae cyanobacterium SM2_3_12]|nr:acylphosphatase [Leptolyngbyaceae cyanobacterium SM2_3_12]
MGQIQAVVYGVVQGVGFRYHTQKMAQGLGLTGYVRNRPEGTVEIVAAGSPEALEALLTWANRGPTGAQVTQLAVTERDGSSQFDGFTIKR